LGPSFKLFFKYILFQIPYTYVYFSAQKNNTINLFLTNNTLLYLIIHIKFSTLFYSSQLSDIFAYELPFKGSLTLNNNPFLVNLKNTVQPSVVVYNFHSMFYHNRLFLFSQHNHQIVSSKVQNGHYTLSSVSEIFPAGNWLERENSELHGINFLGKKDLRNLMLQYGDSSTPFNKSFPSIGTNELVYNPINDTINQVPISVQL
jgi:NADH:ubiquinone oxidoreductase subunit C